MKKILFEKRYTKCGGGTIPRPFSKNSKLRISLDQESKSFIVFLLLYSISMPSSGLSKYIETKLQITCF